MRWLNEYSKKFLENGYLVNGETAEERIRFIADKAQEILQKPGFSDKFYDYMSKGYYSLSSPIWSNFGLDRGLPISCFGSYIGDTMGNILYTQAEVGMMSKFGGGASGYFGALRERGSEITNNGHSSGAVHFMQLFETLVDVVSQGSVRRGHFSPYLPLEHPDAKEFLKIGTEGNPIQKLTHGVTVTDKWLQEMKDGDTEKRALWAEVIQRRGEMGYPYIMFSDNANNGTVDIYKDKEMKIHASNMCFTGDTIVAVADGRNGVRIDELAKESNGVIKFPVYSAVENSGQKIQTTNERVLYEGNFSKIEIKSAIAFKTGTKKVIKLILSNGDVVECTPDHQLALHNGGWVDAIDSKGNELSSIFTYENNNKLINEIPAKDNTNRTNYIFKHFIHKNGDDLIKKGLFVVDIIDEGKVCDVYDLTVEDNHNFFILTSSDDNDFVNSQGILVHNCSEIMLPSSEDESFVCDLSSMNIFYYDEWKDTDAVEVLTYFLDAVMQEFINKLEAMRDSNKKEDQDAFLFLQKAYNFAKRHRALGVGVIGWHSYLQSHRIAFEDAEAYNLNIEIFKLIHDRAYEASKEMAKEYGEPELLKGYGRRNTTLLAVAPTTSSAFILGQVSQSIEPWWSNCYVKDLAKMKVTIKNTELEKILEEKGMNTREVWNSIRDRDGSVQHLEFLTQKEKNIFKTFSEINQYAIIDQAADRQKFIDQGQSLNLMIHPNTSAKDINALYMDAWKQGIKSLYYQHSKSAAQELSRKIVCAGCEA